jgi:hypothetical protein
MIVSALSARKLRQRAPPSPDEKDGFKNQIYHLLCLSKTLFVTN